MMLFMPFSLPFFFARLAKSESRAIHVVFSDKCVVRETERGPLVCQLRVYGTFVFVCVFVCARATITLVFLNANVALSDCMTSKKTLEVVVMESVEAHVRLYALIKHKDADGHPRLEHLRIVSPNDELGAVLFLNIPTVVTHDVDHYSPYSATTTADKTNIDSHREVSCCAKWTVSMAIEKKSCV